MSCSQRATSRDVPAFRRLLSNLRNPAVFPLRAGPLALMLALLGGVAEGGPPLCSRTLRPCTPSG